MRMACETNFFSNSAVERGLSTQIDFLTGDSHLS